MPSVTQRINAIQQPRGGYINISQFTTATYTDGHEIIESYENTIKPNIVGLATDYLTRTFLTNDKEKSFRVSLQGALIAEKLKCLKGAKNAALSLLNDINELDKISIINACKLSTFDAWCRNPKGMMLYYENSMCYYDIAPTEDELNNIYIMVRRSLGFFGYKKSVKQCGFSFMPENANEDELKKLHDGIIDTYGGYTKTVSSGDGDYLTDDTIWDMKVSKKNPDKDTTLQLLMYWIMGQHSNNNAFKQVNKIGVFNPYQNKSYSLDIASIPNETIKFVEEEIICYPK